MAQSLLQNMIWEALHVQVHHKFANIVIRWQLELASSASTLTKTQDTLGFGQTARQLQMGFFARSIGAFLAASNAAQECSKSRS